MSSLTDAVRRADRVGRGTLATLALLMGFASISTDLYLPAMPTMATELRAGAGAIAFTVTGFLVGFSAGQLVWGPVSDRFGRRSPMLAGLALFVAGSAGCATAAGPEAIVAWRLIQALGASAGVVLSRAMVRDLFEGPRAARVLSLLMAVMAIAPLAGPLVGGQILERLGWRAEFWTLVGIGVLTAAAVLALPETLPSARRGGGTLADAFRDYGDVVRDRVVLANAGACGFFFAGTFAYISGSPFAYIVYHHVPAHFYGLLFGTGVLGIVGLNVLNAKLIGRFEPSTLRRVWAVVAAFGGCVATLNAVSGLAGVVGLAIPIFFFVAVTGVIVANGVAVALAARPDRAGGVAAVVGAVQYGSGVAGSAAVGYFADGTPVPMTVVIALGGLGCLGCALLARPPIGTNAVLTARASTLPR